MRTPTYSVIFRGHSVRIDVTCIIVGTGALYRILNTDVFVNNSLEAGHEVRVVNCSVVPGQDKLLVTLLGRMEVYVLRNHAVKPRVSIFV